MFSVIKKQIEKFIEAKKKEGFTSINIGLEASVGIIIFALVLFLLAIYLSLKCNDGINIIDLLFAFFCTPCYLFYRLVLGCNNE